MTALRFITFLWLTFMITLSHIPGEPSGEESKWLSRMTGVKEGVLRRSAHVVVYTILTTLIMLAWSETELWVKCLGLVLIAVADESSKALWFFKGRHCSVAEIGLNLVGVLGGLMLGELLIF